MVCRIRLNDGRLVIEDPERQLRGRHLSQMAVATLHFDPPPSSYVGAAYEQGLLEKLTGYFLRAKVPYELAPDVEVVKAEEESQSQHLKVAREQGARLKEAEP